MSSANQIEGLEPLVLFDCFLELLRLIHDIGRDRIDTPSDRLLERFVKLVESLVAFDKLLRIVKGHEAIFG